MKEIIVSFKSYAALPAVQLSLWVTAFSSVLLSLAVSGITTDRDALGFISFLGLMVELFYGSYVSYSILQKKAKYSHLIPFLFLNWFIGCFAANILINIFENFPIWVYVITFLFCFSNFFLYSNYENRWIKPLAYFVNGFSFLLIVYFMVYLIPMTPISLIGIIALGMGFYGLVPIIVCFCHIYLMVELFRKHRRSFFLFLGGMSVVLLSVLFFAIQVNAESKKMTAGGITKTFETQSDLPVYISVSQQIKPNIFNELLLKKDLVYIGEDNFFVFRGFGNFNLQYNERKTHNPFVNVVYLFTRDPNLSRSDKINILKSNFDKRLETEEQLWSGRELFTKNIKEDIKIYPQSRLAYTEITMDIICAPNEWGQKEAIYSFQLPEGSVATSLSLWVNGVERKGVLTTKEKAQKAYTQIVGVEARDPSLMQWREGNKVVVRVFPINKDLPRTFKCGFTTPLVHEKEELIYKSLSIKGPNLSGAATLSRIQVVGNQSFEADKDFTKSSEYYTNESKGWKTWRAILPSPKVLIPESFVFKGKSYTVQPIQKETVSFIPSDIILDLNSKWDADEIMQLLEVRGQYFVWWKNEKIAITPNNYQELLRQFEDLHYSLLPFYQFKDNSLVITKSGAFSANFEELQNSEYLRKIKSETVAKNIKVINISEEVNPFWQTLKEQHYVAYCKTDLSVCKKLIKQQEFIAFSAKANRINIEPANIAIEEDSLSTSLASTGPDHLYRLYAFGKVLEEQVRIQQDSTAQNAFVDLAKDANIVTPVSSLIVLETDADYEKHGIEKNVDTLGNASINNDGAVPEPHEWLLIVVGMALIIFYYKRHKNFKIV